MALRTEVVNFIRLRQLDHAGEAHRIGEVAVMQKKPHVLFVRVLVKVVDARRIEERRTALEAVNDVALIEQ